MAKTIGHSLLNPTLTVDDFKRGSHLALEYGRRWGSRTGNLSHAPAANSQDVMEDHGEDHAAGFYRM